MCAAAAEDPPDPVRLRWIRERSAVGPMLPAAPPTGVGLTHPPVVETLSLVRRMRACPFRSTDPACGCTGGRCALRRGAAVSHFDCMDCQRRYPDR